MLYIYILYIIYIYHFQSAFITLLVLLHLMADRIRLISLTLEVRGKRTGKWRYLEQSTFTAPHLVTFLMSSRSLSGLSYISSDIRTWASKVWSLLGKNKPLDQWVFIMENQSLLARRLFCQFFSLLLPCKFLFTNAILLLYLKKKKSKASAAVECKAWEHSHSHWVLACFQPQEEYQFQCHASDFPGKVSPLFLLPSAP